MIQAESLVVCFLVPLFIAVLLLKDNGARRFSGFFMVGLVVCLLSGYINAFAADVYDMDVTEAAIKLAPVCEELLKALPVLFYVYVVEATDRNVMTASVAVGLGFTLLENCLYILQYDQPVFAVALIRGLSTGVMHAICALVLGYGLRMVRSLPVIARAGSLAVLCGTSSYHAIFNLLLSIEGKGRIIAYLMPVLTAAIMLALWTARKEGLWPFTENLRER